MPVSLTQRPPVVSGRGETGLEERAEGASGLALGWGGCIQERGVRNTNHPDL